LVKLMGGQLWLEGGGEGSTFCFTAPFSRQREMTQIGAKRPATLRDLSVLVVDDNATSRKILEEILVSWQLKPTIVSSGHEALASLRRARQAGNPFALALIDSQMPEMDGFTLAEHIQKDRTLADTAIIVLTAPGQPQAVTRQRRIAACLAKPVKQSDLWDAIVSTLGTNLQDDPTSLPEHHSSTPKGRRLRILLAEDNVVNQELAAAILRKRGHSVVVAENGREALRALERSPQGFDLILMDVQMPELGGLETTAIIREKEKATGAHIPIVALTAHALDGDRERCLEAGMDAYLSKPIQSDKLRNQVEELASDSFGRKRRVSDRSRRGQVLDGRALLAQVDGNVQLLGKLTRLFLADCPARLSRIRQAVASRDPQALHQAAHALKGSIANFAARDAFDAALKLEKMGKQNDLTGVEDAHRTLENEIRRLQQALAAVGTRRIRKNPVKDQRSAAKPRLKQPTRHLKASPAGHEALSQRQTRNAKSTRKAKTKELA
jgi:CheY-like chemotaxis protein